jgi:hypothetical protein
MGDNAGGTIRRYVLLQTALKRLQHACRCKIKVLRPGVDKLYLDIKMQIFKEFLAKLVLLIVVVTL